MYQLHLRETFATHFAKSRPDLEGTTPLHGAAQVRHYGLVVSRPSNWILTRPPLFLSWQCQFKKNLGYALFWPRLVLWIVATCWSELEPRLLPRTGWEGENLIMTFEKEDDGWVEQEVLDPPPIRTPAELAKELGQAEILSYLSSLTKTWVFLLCLLDLTFHKSGFIPAELTFVFCWWLSFGIRSQWSG